jgi:hypothetical protein
MECFNNLCKECNNNICENPFVAINCNAILTKEELCKKHELSNYITAEHFNRGQMALDAALHLNNMLKAGERTIQAGSDFEKIIKLIAHEPN